LPSKESVIEARNRNNWSLGNDVLYRLCKEYPLHTESEIVSKFWLIGRTYSAAVDRRRASEEKPLSKKENFYEHRLVPAVRNADFDTAFKAVKTIERPTKESIRPIILLHEHVTKTLFSITNQRKVSLAS